MTAWRWSSRTRLYGLAATAILLTGLAAIYVTGPGQGNGDAPCGPAVEVASRLRPLAKGEVAAFQPARNAVSLASLRFKDPAGKDVNLSAFAGKTVLLNLWATWCVPCRAEMPALDRLEAAEGGAGFSVVAVNIDTRESARPKDFLSGIGVSRLAYYADATTEIFQNLKRRGIALGLPTSVLLDGKACQLGVLAGPAEWDSPDAAALIAAAAKAG